MTLFSLLVFLVIGALIFWLVVTYLIPALPAGPVRTVVLIVFIVLCILVLLNVLGFGPNILNTRIGWLPLTAGG